MAKHNGEEYDAVMKLYRDGKITDAQKEALIEALGSSDECQSRDSEKHKTGIAFVFSVSGMNDPYDASNVKRILEQADGAESASADIKMARATVYGEIDPSKLAKALTEAGYPARPIDIKVGDDGNAVDVNIDDDGVTSTYDDDADEKYEENEENDADEDDDADDLGFGAMMSKLGRKVKEAVQKGVQAAALAEKQAEIAINNAFSSTFTSVNGGDYIKHKPKYYDSASYDDMSIYIKYTNGGTSLRWTDKTRNSSKLLIECEKRMDSDMYNQLRKLIDERFVGVHMCSSGCRTLKVVVELDED